MENQPNTPPKNSAALLTPPKTRSTSKKVSRQSLGEPCPQSTSPSTRRNKSLRGPDRRSVTSPLPGPIPDSGPSARPIEASDPDANISDSIIVANEADIGSCPPSPLPRPPLQTLPASAPEISSTSQAINGAGRRRLNRPSASSRLSSERTLHLPESPTGVDDMIKAVMRAKLPRKQRKQRDHGNNYLFEVVPAQDPDKTIWKVGFTTQPLVKRQKAISNACQPHSIRGQYDPGHVPIRLCARAERLTHAELAWHKYHFACMCKVDRHREYFDVDPELALEAIHRWRTFCMREPYTTKGKLQPFWEDRLRDMDLRQSLRADVLNMAERRRQWDRFVHATLLDAIRYDLTVSMKKLQDRGIWRTTAVIEFLAILFLLLPLPRMLTLPYYAMAIWIIAMINETKLSATLVALSWPPVEDLRGSRLSLPTRIEDVSQMEEDNRGTLATDTEALPNDLGHMFDFPLEDDVF